MWHVSYLEFPLGRGLKWALRGALWLHYNIAATHDHKCMCTEGDTTKLSIILSSKRSTWPLSSPSQLLVSPALSKQDSVTSVVKERAGPLHSQRSLDTGKAHKHAGTHSLPCTQHLVTVNENSNITEEGEIHQGCVCVCVCVRRKRAKKKKWQVPQIQECSVVWLMISPQQQLLYSTPTMW